MTDVNKIRPERIDRLEPDWVNWFIQTQKAAAATALANVASTQAQGQHMGMVDPNVRAQIQQQISVMEAQAKIHLSVLTLCLEAMGGPYFTRDTVDEGIDAALAQIDETSTNDEERRLARSGVWKVCKALGVPMGTKS